jgi:hypothetical protein
MKITSKMNPVAQFFNERELGDLVTVLIRCLDNCRREMKSSRSSFQKTVEQLEDSEGDAIGNTEIWDFYIARGRARGK